MSGAQGVLAKEVAVGELPKQGQGKDQKHTSAGSQDFKAAQTYKNETKTTNNNDLMGTDVCPGHTSTFFLLNIILTVAITLVLLNHCDST
jgi:hypothetical protein